MTLMYLLFLVYNQSFLLTFWIQINVDNLEHVHSYSFCFTKMLAHAVISFGICICIFLCFEEVLIP